MAKNKSQQEREKHKKEIIIGSFLADEFHEWIELNEWYFNPVSFNGDIKYRWVNETFSGQLTTKELYEIFLETENNRK